MPIYQWVRVWKVIYGSRLALARQKIQCLSDILITSYCHLTDHTSESYQNRGIFVFNQLKSMIKLTSWDCIRKLISGILIDCIDTVGIDAAKKKCFRAAAFNIEW